MTASELRYGDRFMIRDGDELVMIRSLWNRGQGECDFYARDARGQEHVLGPDHPVTLIERFQATA